MPRALWLKTRTKSRTDFSPLPLRIGSRNADVVVFPASVEQIELAIEFLEADAATRQSALVSLMREVNRTASSRRPRGVASIRPNGLFVLMPHAFAVWLARVLRSDEATREEVRRRLSAWIVQPEATTREVREAQAIP